MKQIHNKKAFGLVEILVGILIVSGVMIAGFQALSSVTIGKARLIQQTDLQKDSIYFTEKLFEMIKKGGTIDYEEYFNRKIRGTTTSSGHYTIQTGFGNFGKDGVLETTTYGNGFYLCRSGSSDKITGTGCVSEKNTASVSLESSADYSGVFQRYGQYSYQFIDYNSNADSDNDGTYSLIGDEDDNNNIVGDDDDEYLGEGPAAFVDMPDGIHELYLISSDKRTRMLFRWNVEVDPSAPTGKALCNGGTLIGEGCRGTIEFLRLIGEDRGLNHDISESDATQYDGVVDTWIIAPEFTGGAEVIAGTTNTDQYWQPLFPESIHVSDFKVYAYPNKDRDLAWKETGVDIAPYVRLKFTLEPSWKTKKFFRNNVPKLDFSTTISLTDIFTK